MDSVDDDGYISNPSSLRAVFHGRRAGVTALTRGVDQDAVRLDGYIAIDTSALQMECFGDINKCNMGKYSLQAIPVTVLLT